MIKKVRIFILICIFILGVIILLYPFITNRLFDEEVKIIENKYKEIIGLQNNLNLLNKLLRDENNKIYNNKQDSFINQKISFEEKQIDLSKYGFNNNIIGFIRIPSINVKLPIYLGASLKNMNYGAVHLTGTSYPIGGINTNSVIAAHRAYYKAKMFRDIDKIKIGDYLYIDIFNETLKYNAVKIDIINPMDFNKLTIVDGKDIVTIMSCHPYKSREKRYVVYFERVI